MLIPYRMAILKSWMNDLSKRAVIQNGDVVESLMSDEEDDMVLRYYNRNKEFLEDMHSA